MKVSVCLASYNGEAFLARQLESILRDLAPNDEIVLSDDGSTDRTVAIAREMGDERLKIHAFGQNLRHVRNFERAFGLATGDLIFPADQDDIWISGKRDRIVGEFARAPSIAMVVHALRLIDAQDRVIAPRSAVWAPSAVGSQPRAAYLVRQLIKNQVTGCATAFRRDLLDLLLPFPKTVYAHDHWMSVAAPFLGDVLFLDEALVDYRQHDANVTPKEGLSLIKRVQVRAKLAILVAIAGNRAIAARLPGLRGE